MLDKHRKRNRDLAAWLSRAITGKTPVSYAQLTDTSEPGIYFVFERSTPVYVGKTGRTGKDRLRELVSDRRSHTLNGKLVAQYLSKKLSKPIRRVGPKTEQKLIGEGCITGEDIARIQREVNKDIRSRFRFLFCPVAVDQMTSREHFAIAVLDPSYND